MKTRRFLSLVLSLALAIPLAVAAPASAADLTYDVPGGKIYFDANTGAITDSDKTITEAVIPSQIYGVTVTAIEGRAFLSCTELASLTIPNTVTSIGKEAFSGCTALTSVVIPNSVTEMGSDVFHGCTGLTSATIGSGLPGLAPGIFSGCRSLSGVTIPSNITYIDTEAFFNCKALTSITIPSSVTAIGGKAFSGSGLTSIYLPDSVTTFLGKTFENCTSLTSARLPGTLDKVPVTMFSGCSQLTDIVIPDGVTEIGAWSFQFCPNLKSITIPASVERVGDWAFRSSEGLTDVYYGGTAMDWSQIEVRPVNNSLLSATIHFAEPVAGFTDVTSNDYYAQAVQWAVDRGVTTGTGANTFSPANTVTRAEAVTFLWRAAGSPEPASAASPFTDVTDPGAYYYKAVLWAAGQGITGGVGGGAFGLTATLSYDQIFTFLCRAAGGSAGGSDWSAAAVNWAVQNGLTDGLTYSASAACPRSDVVYCLWKQMA